MDLEQYLALIYGHYNEAICYGIAIVAFAILWIFFRDGGIPKPKKEDIWPFVKKILQYFENRRSK